MIDRLFFYTFSLLSLALHWVSRWAVVWTFVDSLNTPKESIHNSLYFDSTLTSVSRFQRWHSMQKKMSPKIKKYIYFFCAIAILLWATAAFSDYWWALLLRRKDSSFPKFTLGLHRLDFFVGAASSRSLVTSLSVSKDLNNSSILTAWIGTDEVSSAQESLECEDWKREEKKAQQILIRKGKSSLSQTQASNSLSPILSRVMLNLCWRFGLFPLDELQMCEQRYGCMRKCIAKANQYRDRGLRGKQMKIHKIAIISFFKHKLLFVKNKFFSFTSTLVRFKHIHTANIINTHQLDRLIPT